jgi:hypothetical protein
MAVGGKFVILTRGKNLPQLNERWKFSRILYHGNL